MVINHLAVKEKESLKNQEIPKKRPWIQKVSDEIPSVSDAYGSNEVKYEGKALKSQKGKHLTDRIANHYIMRTARVPARILGRIMGGPKDKEKKAGRKILESIVCAPITLYLAANIVIGACGTVYTEHQANQGDNFWNLGQRYGKNYIELQESHFQGYGRDLWVGDEVGIWFAKKPHQAAMNNVKNLNHILISYIPK